MEPANLDCPKCVGKLDAVTVDQTAIDVCFICHGAWFDVGELDKVLKVEDGFFRNFGDQATLFDKAAVVDDFNAKIGRCPRCGGTMAQKKFKGTVIDQCPQDHGIWLDGGELQNVIIHDLKIKYGIFWVVVFVLMIALSRGRVLGLLFNSASFGKGLSGGAGASDSF